MYPQVSHHRSVLSASRKALFAVCIVACSCMVSAQPQEFDTPADAASAIVKAAESGTIDDLYKIFGPEAEELISTGDEVQDKALLQEFKGRVLELTGISKQSETSATLIIGNEAHPFAIPLVREGDKWHFDLEQGREELINRRVGKNEIDTINAIRAYIAAQIDYKAIDYDDDGILEYAQKFISSEGEKDGLYWPAEDGDEESPLGGLFASAAAEGYDFEDADTATTSPRPFHGYRFKILTKQGPDAVGGERSYLQEDDMVAGFAVVAYPVEYGNSGVMTFIASDAGDVYQKDLGESSGGEDPPVDEFNPDSTWELVE